MSPGGNQVVQAQLGGFAGERLRRNVRQWINTFDIHRYVGLVENRKPGGATLAGLWLEAATYACEWAGDALLRQRAMGMLERLLAAVDPADPLFEPLGGAFQAAADVWDNGPAMAVANRLPAPPTVLPEDPNGVEALVWNRLFPLQTVDGDGFRADLPPSGWRPQGYYAGPLESDARTALALTKIPGLFYVAESDGIRINHYGPSSAQIGDIRVRQTTQYPSDGTVRIEIEPGKTRAFTIRLRVPPWCGAPRIALNGRSISTFSIGRKWNAGDRIDLNFPMEPRWRKGTGAQAGLLSLERGPLAYFAEAEPGVGAGRVIGIPANQESLGPAYKITGSGVAMMPLANLGEWYKSDAEKSRWLEAIASHPAWAGDAARGRDIPYSIWLRFAP